ncbi:MAG: hydrogenase expression/formation protein HypE [Victivallales bacterium]|nr:hydrogenase expression/formation protein HypE [Victivallales bacterium]
MTDKIQIAHGGGGRLSSQLIDDQIVSRFGDGPLKGLPDAASLPGINGRIIYSTDSYVVQPIEFPGGNIGNLAIHGTVNDISVAGGKPLWISLSLIIEEGFEMSTFRKVLDTIKSSAEECGVKVVTGDTKVVAKGQCDKIFINTSGIGEAFSEFTLNKTNIKPGDKIIVNGTVGDHGMAVLTAREGINIINGPESDTASVHRLVESAREFGGHVKFMRDPTRGGVATVLNEIVENNNFGIKLKETELPVSPGTHSISEILGIDPLALACEGRMLLVCSPEVSEKILQKWKKFPEGKKAKVIGTATEDRGMVLLEAVTGGTRLVDVPLGELLPRIC